MGRIAIVGYRPKPGQSEVLRGLLETHVSILREQGLATAREPVLMQAADGTMVEVFEWVSPEAIVAAHENPAVQSMWADFAAACDYIPVGGLTEATEMGALVCDSAAQLASQSDVVLTVLPNPKIIETVM